MVSCARDRLHASAIEIQREPRRKVTKSQVGIPLLKLAVIYQLFLFSNLYQTRLYAQTILLLNFPTVLV